MNLREAFLAASKPAPKKIVVEGIEADVYIRVLTVGEIIDQQKDTKDDDNRPAIARAFARVVVDADNQSIYDTKAPEDIAAILALPWPFVKRIMEQANIINGVAAAETAAKN
jgi:hypothetical protein